MSLTVPAVFLPLRRYELDYVIQYPKKFFVLASTEIMVLPSLGWRTGLKVLIQGTETGVSFSTFGFLNRYPTGVLDRKILPGLPLSLWNVYHPWLPRVKC